MNKAIIQIKDLNISFKTFAGQLKAIRGINLSLYAGETLAIVGESGSGKSVTTRALMGLLAKNATIEAGEVIFENRDLLKLSKKEMEAIRGSKIAMIFQDPMTALNPTLSIGRQITEILIRKRDFNHSEARKEAINLLDLCGIVQAEKRIDQYPHQFSGGQRQRIVIAIALAGNPEVLIADEPTTALDVTIQAQIIELLKKIQKEKNMTIIFITHDLGVVANVADRIAVMYAGKIVEMGSVDDIYYHPQHPYTWGLLTAMPTISKQDQLYAIPGSPPDLLNPPEGDAFAYRSEYALAIDYEKEPPMFEVSPGHYAATWLLHPMAPKMTPPPTILERYQHYQEKQSHAEKVRKEEHHE
ncbi:ABC transporter ATP-binding protein [Facklamia sp. 7083-14-GEN3]|uniref:ABC transporter ATP-binding protein n=1 Tax=Facklamia sp. 7083-14-GEN3 TaxID=2973478 RepID=UPI00215C36EF|nr:ABC transporter ATP-binding protein [Facklamia sp. 7083-14-GEN3]MCR8969895.1 ABC transporter ATP-binding protein [Facklamia sp. 7083-14-GEN3]